MSKDKIETPLDTTEFQLIDLEKRISALEKVVELLIQGQTDHTKILSLLSGEGEILFEPDEELLKEIDPDKKGETH